MIRSILVDLDFGPSLDIHSGGDDLIFPHHENECAQSECLTGTRLANYWLHNGMVMVNGSKMSKSENNFFTIKDLLKKYKANTIRYFAFSTHYKKQINFCDEALISAQRGFDKLLEAISGTTDDQKLDQGLIKEFTFHMDNDFNTAQALALLFDNKDKSATVAHLLTVLGFDLSASNSNTQLGSSDKLAKVMDLLLELREKARNNKDFATSDFLRDSLLDIGIVIKDQKNTKSEWQIK